MLDKLKQLKLPLGKKRRADTGTETPSYNSLPINPPDLPTSGWAGDVFRVSKAILRALSILAAAPALDAFIESLEARPVAEAVPLGKEELKEFCDNLIKSVDVLMGKEGSNERLKGNLLEFHSTLSQISQEMQNGRNDVERMGRKITQIMHSFILVNGISGIIKMEKSLAELEKHVLTQCIRDIPHVDAAYNDYESQRKYESCLDGTREALLDEIAQWISALENLQIYLLSGIAGIGKTTVAYTIAERAERIGYLGASFFFSRGGGDRSNAKKFFTTIAFQLCLYDKVFAQAIEAALLTERGLAAITKNPNTQLEVLILEPLRAIVRARSSPVVIVVDALDECDDRDAPPVLAGLNRLVQDLRYFKVILTTRPEPHLPPLSDAHKVFHLQNIEEQIIEGDIRLYLARRLSQGEVSKRLLGLRSQWGASDSDLDHLTQLAGRLFIIASTVVLFILDNAVRNPASQMQYLQCELDQNQSPFETLNDFYTIILREAIPSNSKPNIIQRFRIVVGSVIFIQTPLSIKVLGRVVDMDEDDICAVLDNLQSVISLGNSDTPIVYHKSFPDFLTTTAHGKDSDLRVVPIDHHTRLAIRCLKIMNNYLKQNILGLGTPARFMDNDDGLAAENMLVEELVERIPGELRYACTYWANHVDGADKGDAMLIEQLKIFTMEHLLHWLEALSWIGKLDAAYAALCIVQTYMESTYPDLSGLIADTLHFITKFYRRIQRSALHTYYSALSFTPPDCHLYQRCSKDLTHRLCRLEGTPTQWGAAVTYFGQGLQAMHIAFARDSSKFALSSGHRGQQMRLWDAENGMLLQTYEGNGTTIADDFSIVAVSHNRTVTLWSVAGNAPVTSIEYLENITEVTLSFDGSRLAVGLSNGTVDLRNAREGGFIASLNDYLPEAGQLGFSPSGCKLLFVSGDGTIQLWSGGDGRLINRLDYKSKKHVKSVFSRDGRRLASLVKKDNGYCLTLWDGETGALIAAANHASGEIAISDDGSLIATGGGKTIQLWSGNPLSVVRTLDIGGPVYSLAISHNILAAGSTEAGSLTLFDLNKHTVIATLQAYPVALALSPDCLRLAVGVYGNSRLYDVRLLKKSTLQHSSHVTALAFAPNSSHLAAGFHDGTIELWDTNRTDRPIKRHARQAERIVALAFALDGEQFVSGSDDKTASFWSGTGGEPMGELGHAFADAPTSLAFSPNLLAVATRNNITLFDKRSLSGTLCGGGYALSFCADGSLLASASTCPTGGITVWNVAELAAIATFTTRSDIYKLIFSPDGSQLAAQSKSEDGSFEFIDIVNRNSFELVGYEDLSWIPNLMNGVLISWRFDNVRRDCLIGHFPGHQTRIAVLWISEEMIVACFEAGSSILALGCSDGRILFVRPQTTNIA